MLRVAILALSAKSYGGASYIQAILPALARYEGDAEFIIIARTDSNLVFFPESGKLKIRMSSFWGHRLGVIRILWENIWLPFVLKKIGADVVYTTTNTGILFSPVPCVTMVRNMEPFVPVLKSAQWRRKMRLRTLKWLTIASAKRAGRVIAVSNYVKDTLTAYHVPAGNIEVIYHGVDDLDLTGLNAKGNSGGGYVASAAKFVRYANLETLFRAFARMRELGYEGELHFAGGPYDREYEVEVRSLIQELGIMPYVRFLGYIPREKVQMMIRDCDAFLFSSTLEACPFTLLEAMRQGAAIVTTTARPMPEFCGDAALMVRPDDADAFGEAGYRIVSSPDLRAHLRQSARSRSERFTWRDSVKRLIHVLGEAACVS